MNRFKEKYLSCIVYFCFIKLYLHCFWHLRGTCDRYQTSQRQIQTTVSNCNSLVVFFAYNFCFSKNNRITYIQNKTMKLNLTYIISFVHTFGLSKPKTFQLLLMQMRKTAKTHTNFVIFKKYCNTFYSTKKYLQKKLLGYENHK